MNATAWQLRPIEARDNLSIFHIIRAALAEFGADVPGTAWGDPQLKTLFEWYQGQGMGYWVVDFQGQVVGGCGIAPLAGGDNGQCELQKMYLAPQARGQGIGKALAQEALRQAITLGYQFCYLETLPNMTAAIGLYEHLGFQRLQGPVGQTGHHHCDVRYGLSLES